MKIKLTDNNYIGGFVEIGDYDIEVSDELITEDMMINPCNYQMVNGQFIQDTNMAAQTVIDTIRYNREKECFSYINRGQLWYSHLTNTQKAELDLWYQDWLDAPQTLIVPTKPEWLI